METKPHMNEPLYLENGSIASEYHNSLYGTLAIIIDTNSGCLHKYGEADMVKEYYSTMVAKFNTIDSEMAKDLVYIEFNPKTGNNSLDEYLNAQLSKDEICTLVNYFMNSIGPDMMNKILSMDADTLHKKLQSLADIGF